jgi:nucleoside-diphosphate-sugar epimerase
VRLLVFGCGYTSRAFVRRHRAAFSRIAATARSADRLERLRAEGILGIAFDGFAPAHPALRDEVASADAILVSIPPDETGDPVLRSLGEALRRAPARWIGYLSTVGVYGDHGGAWVDEATPPRPASRRSHQRVAAEEAWLALARDAGRPVHVFRLAGIYGPGRSPLAKVTAGRARRIVKAGQVFNRIHVDDIADVLMGSLARPRAGAVYNVADDEPAPPQDVVAFAAGLTGVAPPPEVAFDHADLTPMARSFYGENKRVANRLLREELGVRLSYPTYREGLRALWHESSAAA